jgi:hypothetical protein
VGDTDDVIGRGGGGASRRADGYDLILNNQRRGTRTGKEKEAVA